MITPLFNRMQRVERSQKMAKLPQCLVPWEAKRRKRLVIANLA